MNDLVALLRLSTIQVELRELAGDLDANAAKVVERSAALLNLVGSTMPSTVSETATNVVTLDDFRNPSRLMDATADLRIQPLAPKCCSRTSIIPCCSSRPSTLTSVRAPLSERH
ncbi:MAG TPA: hypothetical protein VFK05_29585 [Polyangiaceae bacterium]|nr:hypothetical protein [Polyangiaceae bacterium]